jgi:hypothetical protein
MSSQPRSDEELRELGEHVLWHARQFCFLAIHLEERQGGHGVTRFDYPLDAAALEAFLIHTRALADFLWGSPGRRRRDDAFAADYFVADAAASKWRGQGTLPGWYGHVRDPIGYGIAHVSYKCLALSQAWTWQHRLIGHEVAARLMEFADAAPAHRVDPQWTERISEAADPVLRYLPRDTRPIGTPVIARFRNPPPP